jgi:hypothetical protein
MPTLLVAILLCLYFLLVAVSGYSISGYSIINYY